ncbi:helix-turn-helix domain-containing protein [Candidatus Peregrinibacteria bacterium]|nr:helix-turn-helix domain-containing protein [Candidatus Peregrinibacteria bacterium]
MPRDINERQVQELLDQGLSERAIAQQLNIPRTTLKRHLAKRGTQNVHQSVPNTHELPTTPGIHEVYQGIPQRTAFAP